MPPLRTSFPENVKKHSTAAAAERLCCKNRYNSYASLSSARQKLLRVPHDVYYSAFSALRIASPPAVISYATPDSGSITFSPSTSMYRR